jgi:hypothetical protein
MENGRKEIRSKVFEKIEKDIYALMDLEFEDLNFYTIEDKTELELEEEYFDLIIRTLYEEIKK